MNETNVEQLISWSQKPGLLPRVRSRVHKDKAWDQLADDILADLAKDRDVDVSFSATTEIRRRGAVVKTAAAPEAQGPTDIALSSADSGKAQEPLCRL